MNSITEVCKFKNMFVSLTSYGQVFSFIIVTQINSLTIIQTNQHILLFK